METGHLTGIGTGGWFALRFRACSWSGPERRPFVEMNQLLVILEERVERLIRKIIQADPPNSPFFFRNGTDHAADSFLFPGEGPSEVGKVAPIVRD